MHLPPVASQDDAPREAVLRLFLQHQSMLGGFLYGLTADWELVEEALQESAVFICARWHEFAPGSDFGAWVRAIARLRCREAIRRRARARGVDVDDLADELTDADWAACEGRDAERKEALSRCLRELPDRDRELVELRYLQQLRCDALAARLGRTAEALYMSLSRLRRRLRACVDKRLQGTTA